MRRGDWGVFLMTTWLEGIRITERNFWPRTTWEVDDVEDHLSDEEFWEDIKRNRLNSTIETYSGVIIDEIIYEFAPDEIISELILKGWKRSHLKYGSLDVYIRYKKNIWEACGWEIQW